MSALFLVTGVDSSVMSSGNSEELCRRKGNADSGEHGALCLPRRDVHWDLLSEGRKYQKPFKVIYLKLMFKHLFVGV